MILIEIAEQIGDDDIADSDWHLGAAIAVTAKQLNEAGKMYLTKLFSGNIFRITILTF